jgi:NADH:ubiquinone oxidoreductase subunit 6 (subunit J)
MSVESQKLLEILQYICFAGLVLSGLAGIFLPGRGKKAAALFIIMVFITILSFIFYAGIMVFLINIVFVFVFAVLYLFTRSQTGPEKSIRYDGLDIAAFAAAVLFCAGLGYIIFNISRQYFPEEEINSEMMITTLEDITVQVFSRYPVAIIVLAAAALTTFTSFTVWDQKRQKDKGVQ